jgi:hypothetical protein
MNYKFKELLICKILQIIYQTLSLIIKVLQILSILQGMCLKEWRYLIKQFTPNWQKEGEKHFQEARYDCWQAKED